MSQTSARGMYCGAGSWHDAPDKLDANGVFLGKPMDVGTEYILATPNYVNFRSTQTTTYQLQPWATWKAADPDNRKMAWVVPPICQGMTSFQPVYNGSKSGFFWWLGEDLVDNGMGDSIIRIGHEANNPGMTWTAGEDPDGYRWAFQKIVSVMRAVPDSNFTFEWNPCLGELNEIQEYSDFYPGDAYVDYIGINVYHSWWNAPLGANEVEIWEHLLEQQMGLNEFMDFARSQEKLISCPEWGVKRVNSDGGFTGGGDSPYFIHQMADLFLADKFSYQSYFNWDFGGGVLEDFPDAREAYRVRFSS